MTNAFSVLETANFYEPTQRAIRDMRFGDKQENYFFVVDVDGLFWVHPGQPGGLHGGKSRGEHRDCQLRIQGFKGIP